MKVFFLDDESIVVDELINLLDWRAKGYEISGFAYNAVDALRKFEQTLPDILFLDVSLPVTNGLEFAQLINKRFPFIVIIILSAYKNFDYAQSAIESNVLTYLVKHELTVESMEKTLEKAFLESQKRHRDSYLIRSKTMADILSGNGMISWKDTELSVHFSDYSYQFYMILICSAKKFSLDKGFIKDFNKFEDEAKNLFSFSEFKLLDLFVYNNYYLLLLNKSNSNEAKIHSALHSELSQNIAKLSTRYNHPFFALFSYQKCTQKDLQGRFNQLLKNENRYIFGSFSEAVVTVDKSVNQDSYSADCQSLKQLLRLLEFSIAERDADKFINICTAMITKLMQDGADMTAISHERIYYVNDVILELTSCVQRHELKQDQYQKVSPMIRFVLNCVEKNYSTSLKLSVIAKQLNSNPMYVGQKFISEMGKPFHDYLTEYRVLRAKEILTTTNLKMFEIAQRVGINNSQYFSKVFKQYAGVGPLEYRQQKYKAVR